MTGQEIAELERLIADDTPPGETQDGWRRGGDYTHSKLEHAAGKVLPRLLEERKRLQCDIELRDALLKRYLLAMRSASRELLGDSQLRDEVRELLFPRGMTAVPR